MTTSPKSAVAYPSAPLDLRHPPTLNAPPNVLRLLGTSGTYLGGLLLCIAVLSSA
jgi:hypothetical protein